MGDMQEDPECEPTNIRRHGTKLNPTIQDTNKTSSDIRSGNMDDDKERRRSPPNL